MIWAGKTVSLLFISCLDASFDSSEFDGWSTKSTLFGIFSGKNVRNNGKAFLKAEKRCKWAHLMHAKYRW